jgi:hypothetical protein
MTALAAERFQTRRLDELNNDPLAAAVKAFAGGVVVLDSAGNAKPGVTGVGLIPRGIALATVDNSTGAAGDLRVETRSGIFRLENSAAGDAITAAEIGDVCYLVDDQTVAKTSNNGARSVAGVIEDVDAVGVWVRVGERTQAAGGSRKTQIQFQNCDLIGASAKVYRWVATVAGDITRLFSVIDGALTTGDATLTLKINGVAVTTGVITVTQAGSAAGDVDSCAPTAARTVAIGDVVSLTVGGTNDAAKFANATAEITS